MSQLRQGSGTSTIDPLSAGRAAIEQPWPFRQFPGLEAPGTRVTAGDRFRADAGVAMLVTCLIGTRVSINYGVTVGLLAGLAILPLWAARVLLLRPMRALTLIGVLSIGSGLILTALAPFGSSVVSSDMLTNSVLVLTLIANTGSLVWAAMMLGPAKMAVAFGLGTVLGIPFNVSDQANLWRFTYSLAISAFVLALVDQTRRLGLQLTVLAGLAAVGLLNDSRSNSSFLLMAGILLIGQRLVLVGPAISRRRRALSVLGLALAAGLVLYQMVVGAILEGAFGEATQQRTLAQIDQSGSLILGGRPEIAASIALIARHPFGLGSGARASWNDVAAAKQAMWDIGYDPENGYVQRYMFGQGVEVHSMLGDLWLRFGLVGAALVLFVAIIIIGALVRDFARGAITALFAYASIRFLWDLLFSPFASSLRLLPLVLATAVCSWAIPGMGPARPAEAQPA